MLEIFFMRGTQILAICRNISTVPSMGDVVAIGKDKGAVKEIIWHLDHETWVEVQI